MRLEKALRRWSPMQRAAVVALAVLLGGCSTWTSFGWGGCQKATIDDVRAMVKEGVSEDVIISKIQQCPGDYDLTAARIIELHKEGLSEKILDAMLKAETANQRSYAVYPYYYPPGYWWYYHGGSYPWGPWWGGPW